MPYLSTSRADTVSETPTPTTGPADRHNPAITGVSCQTVVSSMTLPRSIAPKAAANSSSATLLDHIGMVRTAARSTAGVWCRRERHIVTAIAPTATTAAAHATATFEFFVGNSMIGPYQGGDADDHAQRPEEIEHAAAGDRGLDEDPWPDVQGDQPQ